MAKGTVNKVTLIGRLGQDPEIRFTGDGNAIASFSVATNESWKNKNGEIQERTEWTKCTVFGATAEKYVQPYLITELIFQHNLTHHLLKEFLHVL